LERGTFNEPIPKLMIFVPDSGDGGAAKGIFISDERDSETPRVIVAERYEVVLDPAHDLVSLHLLNGVIHNRPDLVDQYEQIGFASYDLRLNLNQSGYAAVEERPTYETILAQLNESRWTDTAALRRLMEHYKDLAFPTASLVFCLLGVPVGIVSKRSGRIGGFAVGVLIVVVYYVLNVGCEFLVTTLTLSPFVGAWMPNGLFMLITASAFWTMSRR
jgi:lipopolysaccharide export system permease protein